MIHFPSNLGIGDNVYYFPQHRNRRIRQRGVHHTRDHNVD